MHDATAPHNYTAEGLALSWLLDRQQQGLSTSAASAHRPAHNGPPTRYKTVKRADGRLGMVFRELAIVLRFFSAQSGWYWIGSRNDAQSKPARSIRSESGWHPPRADRRAGPGPWPWCFMEHCMRG